MSSSGMRVVYKMFYDYCILKARINLWFLIKKIFYRDWEWGRRMGWINPCLVVCLLLEESKNEVISQAVC